MIEYSVLCALPLPDELIYHQGVDSNGPFFWLKDDGRYVSCYRHPDGWLLTLRGPRAEFRRSFFGFRRPVYLVEYRPYPGSED
jgi:hypothetical protein